MLAHTNSNDDSDVVLSSMTNRDILSSSSMDYSENPNANRQAEEGEESPLMDGANVVVVPPPTSSSLKRRKPPKLQLKIPSISNESIATDVSSQGGRSVFGGDGGGGRRQQHQHQPNSNRSKGTTSTTRTRPPSTTTPGIPNFLGWNGGSIGSTSINLLRNTSAESSISGGMTPLSSNPAALISPNHVGATPTALHTPNPVSYLLPQMAGLSLLSPTMPLSPNVPTSVPTNGSMTTTTNVPPSLTRMNSAESTASGTVKIIDGELTRTDSLTSTTSFPPPMMRPSQPMTPSATATTHGYHPHHHHQQAPYGHARGWTPVETPRLPSHGHFVPFAMISPQTTRSSGMAGATPTAQQNRHFFGSQQQQQQQPSPHLASMTNGATTSSMLTSATGYPSSHHGVGAPRGPPPGPPIPSGFSVPMHAASSYQPHNPTGPHPFFGAAPTGWHVMSSVPTMATMQQQQQQHAFGGQRGVHHLTQQVHHGVMNHHAHHHLHHHRGHVTNADLYSMKDGSGMSSSVSVGSNSSQKTGGGDGVERQENFYNMKMRAKNEVGSMPVCRHWLKGTCWYGSTCKFRHPDAETLE